MTTLYRSTFVAILLTSALAFAQGTYTQIDYPGALQTQAFGINSARDVVGFYTDTTYITHGFLLSGNSYTAIDYPGARFTQLNGINNVGEIAGYAILATNNRYVGFTYNLQTQVFTRLKVTGAYQTFPSAINNRGTVVGWIGNINGNAVGFEWDPSGRNKLFRAGIGATFLLGITDFNTGVGQFYLPDEYETNFFYYRKKSRGIKIPSLPNALVNGINPSDTMVVGQYYQSSPAATVGFVLQPGSAIQPLQNPGSSYTVATGINDAGEAVGWFSNDAGYHGFTWTPSAPTETK